MFHVVLVEPEIPQNTGNIVRTCAATGCKLHLVRPFGFEISDKYLKRAGLDYWHLVDISYYDCIEELFDQYPLLVFLDESKENAQRRKLPRRRFPRFRKGDARASRRVAERALRRGCAHSHDRGGALSESFQFGRRRRVRGVAAGRVYGIGKAGASAPPFFGRLNTYFIRQG